MRAQLALMGFESQVQRITVNDTNTWQAKNGKPMVNANVHRIAIVTFSSPDGFKLSDGEMELTPTANPRTPT